MSDNNGAKNGFHWWLQYVLIPVGVAVIAGGFALTVAFVAGLRQQGIAGLEVTRDFEILATQLAVTAESSRAAVAAVENEEVSEVEPTTVPATATPTSTPPPTPLISPTVLSSAPCGQVPAGWQSYLVTRGDTLYSLAGQTGTTVATIQQVNCLSGTQINDGQRIWLPAIPPTEPPTAPPTETPTLPPTEPPTVPPTPDGDVMVVRAWTADRNRIPKTTFEPGDPIEWVLNVENTTGSDAKIELTYELSDASGGSVGLWNGTVTAGAGTSEWALLRTVSPNTVGTNTFIGSGSYNVTTSEAVVVYNVIGPAPPEIISPTPTSTATLTPTPTWTPSPPPVVPPDLTVSGISSISSICPGGSGTCVTEVRFDVANVGSGNADAFNIRIVADPSQSVIVDQPFGGLASRDTQTLTITTPPGGGCFDPDCTVCVTVDSDQRITESDEGNNLLCETRLG